MAEKMGRDIPPAELEVLSVLWRVKKGTVRDVWEEFHRQGKKPAYNTVLTLLGRLRRRGYVRMEQVGRAHVYCPTVRRRQVLTERVGNLLDKIGEDSVPPLVMHLVRDYKLSPEDLRDLRTLLEQLEQESAKRK